MAVYAAVVWLYLIAINVTAIFRPTHSMQYRVPVIIGSKTNFFKNLQERQKCKFWVFIFLFVLQFIVLIKFNFIF